jgi:uncharacterized phage protein (TIGR01671 family)
MRQIKFRAWVTDEHYHVTKMIDWEAIQEYMKITGANPFKSERLTLMQYTGLKDANGRDIYEGDIMTGGRRVEWDVTGQWVLRDESDTVYEGIWRYVKAAEVIGNIYEGVQV